MKNDLGISSLNFDYKDFVAPRREQVLRTVQFVAA